MQHLDFTSNNQLEFMKYHVIKKKTLHTGVHRHILDHPAYK